MVGVEHRSSVGIQLGQAQREELHQLAGVIFVGGGAFDGVGFIVVRHVQIGAHGGTQGDGFDDVGVAAEGVIAEDSPVGRKGVSRMHRNLRHHPDLREDERHALPQLIRPGDRILKTRR